MATRAARRGESDVLLERVEARERTAADREQPPALVQRADVEGREPECLHDLGEARLRARVVARVEDELPALGVNRVAAIIRAYRVLNALTTCAPGASDATRSLLEPSPKSSTCMGEKLMKALVASISTCPPQVRPSSAAGTAVHGTASRTSSPAAASVTLPGVAPTASAAAASGSPPRRLLMMTSWPAATA